MAKRSIIYVDGFNLYYGAIKGGPYKWLDLERLFQLLRNDDDLQRIHYFTARINGPTRPNQDRYLLALATRELVQITEGYFRKRELDCRVRQCNFAGKRTFMRPEEKRTDVAIAVQMLADAYEDRCDIFVLVTGDSDLVPPVQVIKNRFPEKKVVVYVPALDPSRGAAVELRSAADKHRTLPMQLVKKSQFPRQLPDGAGGVLTKPADW